MLLEPIQPNPLMDQMDQNVTIGRIFASKSSGHVAFCNTYSPVLENLRSRGPDIADLRVVSQSFRI